MTGDQAVSGLTLPLWEEVLWSFLVAWDSLFRPSPLSPEFPSRKIMVDIVLSLRLSQFHFSAV